MASVLTCVPFGVHIFFIGLASAVILTPILHEVFPPEVFAWWVPFPLLLVVGGTLLSVYTFVTGKEIVNRDE